MGSVTRIVGLVLGLALTAGCAYRTDDRPFYVATGDFTPEQLEAIAVARDDWSTRGVEFEVVFVDQIHEGERGILWVDALENEVAGRYRSSSGDVLLSRGRVGVGGKRAEGFRFAVEHEMAHSLVEGHDEPGNLMAAEGPRPEAAVKVTDIWATERDAEHVRGLR